MSDVSQRPRFSAIVFFSLRRVWWPALALPWIIVLTAVPLYVQGYINVPKQPAETIAPILLSLALLIAVVRLIRDKTPWLLWLTLMLFAFLCREFHFAGTSLAVYLAFLTLMFVAWYRYPLYASYFGSRLVLTLFVTALFCYFVAVGLDGHWWKFLPGTKYQWADVEEYVEVTGHLFMLALAVFAKPVDNHLLKQQT